MAFFWCRGEDDDPEDAAMIEADDAEEAAEEAAERRDANSADYPDEQAILVSRDQRTWAKFQVVAESVRQYCAYEQ
jgi:hypothetical protein